MDKNLEIMKDYIIDNLDGNEADNTFLQNLFDMATIKESDIESKSTEIIEHINKIRLFLNGSRNDMRGINEIKDMFGFINDDGNRYDINIKVDKNFYFFVADIKIKSVVFLMRVYCFIKKYQNHQGNADDIVKVLEDCLKNKFFDLIQNMCESYSEKNINSNEYFIDTDNISIKLCENDKKNENGISKYNLSNDSFEKINENITFIKKIDQRSFFKITDGEFDNYDGVLRLTVLYKEYLISKENKNIMEDVYNKLISSRIKSLRYFIFDNRMREVKFYGLASEFMWLWEQEKEVYLFRNVTEKDPDENFECKTGIEYMKLLMEKIRSHVSGNNIENAISYSRNPIRDIYKYISIPDEQWPKGLYYIKCVLDLSYDENKEIIINPEININFNEEKKAELEIIKGAVVNSLKITSDSGKIEKIDFYEYFNRNNITNTKFCIEYCKSNSIVPEKTGRKLRNLYNYLCTWSGLEKKFTESHISEADDEVVVSPGYFDNNFDNTSSKNYNLNIKEYIQLLFLLLEFEVDDKYKAEEMIKKSLCESLCESLKNRRYSITDKESNLIKSIRFSDIKMDIEIKYADAIKFNSNNIEECNRIDDALISYVKNSVTEEILDHILEIDDNIDKLDEIMVLIKEAVGDNSDYKNARKKDFSFYNNNSIGITFTDITFWKKIFKSCKE